MAGLEFSASQAALRIRRVQAACKRHGLDGVLLVPGVDGRFSVCGQALGYLAEGASGRDALDHGGLAGGLDDAVALITPTSVCLYAPDPALADRLSALLAPRCPSLRLFGPSPAEAADADAAEEAKLGALVALVRGCSRLGVPCALAPAAGAAAGAGPGAAANGGPPPDAPPRLQGAELMALEQWPLLQAYGLEGVGRSGFFTMNFQVYDMQPLLYSSVYGAIDGRALAVLAGEAVPVLRQHWEEMLQALGGKPHGQRSKLTEQQVAEPLVGYFAYGMLRTAPGVEQAVTLPPRFVAGPRSSDDAATAGAAPLASLGGGGGGGAGGDGPPPLHAVVEAADPRSGLRVGRTLLLCRGAAERDVFADPDEEAEEGYSFAAACAAGAWAERTGEAVGLARAYAALAEAARAAMEHFATVDTATPASTKARAAEVLAARAEAMGAAGAGPGGGGELARRLRMSLLQIDHANHVTAPAVKGSRQLKVLRLFLPDMAAPSGRPLGGLVYADTFLDITPLPPAPHGPHAPHAPHAAANGAASVGRSGANGGAAGGGANGGWRLLVLTEGVPVLRAVPVGGAEEGLDGRALKSLARVAGGAGSQPARLQSGRATVRDAERRAGAAAAAAAEAQAARLRALRGPGGGEDEEDEEEEGDSPTAAAKAPAAPEAPARPPPAEALGRLLSVGGGDDCVLLTGAPACPALSGSLYAAACGLVFVEGVSRAVWTLDLRGPGLEALTFQQLAPHPHAHPYPRASSARSGSGSSEPESPSSASSGAAAPFDAPSPSGPPSGTTGGGLGEALVFRGSDPACGLAPACHLTTNPHLALALGSMSPGARRSLITAVLPAWQQTLREAASAAAAGAPQGGGASYLKDMGAANPFAQGGPGLYAAHAFAVQSSAAAGAPKAWPGLAAPDPLVEAALEALDAAELLGPLAATEFAAAEALLLHPPPSAAHTAATASSLAGGPGPGGCGVVLVAGQPGGEAPGVAAAVAGMLGPEAQVALLPASAGALAREDFAAALQAAASAWANRPRTAGTTNRHLVIATASYVGLPDQINMLAAAAGYGANGQPPAAGGSYGGGWWLTGVVAAVAAEAATEEAARGAAAPGLLGLLAPGWVDCVVLGGEANKVAPLASLASERLPGVPQVRSGRQQLARAREELLPRPQDRAARRAAAAAAAARRGWAPLEAAAAAAPGGGGRLGGPGGGLLGPLAGVRVAVEGALDLAKLKEELRALGLPSDPDAPPRLPLADPAQGGAGAPAALAAVTGCLRLPGAAAGAAGGGLGGSAAARVVEVVGTRAAAVRAREWALAEASVVAGAPWLPPQDGPGGELLLIGTRPALAEPALRALLARCAAASPSPSPASAPPGPVPASAKDLTPQQRTAIRAARAWDPLPDGYTYDGSGLYYDPFGDTSRDHPDMARFVEEWIQDLRARAAAQGEACEVGVRVVRFEGPTPL
ncbi:hypothetical protein HYH03_017009 [Edaphochlamys debaryana]|uniref:DAAF9 N-terminal domain-containing protein n=1 Tax=Edaphochlamys debaryana TaxID=47281 RepID=A0A836BPQ9_9CHLO|nr:hypothetical protein HYH03_017009 [Edaphochlamys debaryana]|eukprot:KAG2484197.1 hypothetical protein HYH03_017009 [Edaphochlamys debaryana]